MTISSQRFHVLSGEAVGEPDQLALFDRAEAEMAHWISSEVEHLRDFRVSVAYVPVAAFPDTIGFFLVHLVYEAEEPTSGGSGDVERREDHPADRPSRDEAWPITVGSS